MINHVLDPLPAVRLRVDSIQVVIHTRVALMLIRTRHTLRQRIQHT